MKNHATEILLAGRKFVDPIMTANGFAWETLWAGQSSGGLSDSGRYVKGDRNLELHFRGSLGLVTYHIGTASLSHEQYMRHVAPRDAAQYPGFSEEPLGPLSISHMISTRMRRIFSLVPGLNLKQQKLLRPNVPICLGYRGSVANDL